jgi:hypothetical protein
MSKNEIEVKKCKRRNQEVLFVYFAELRGFNANFSHQQYPAPDHAEK